MTQETVPEIEITYRNPVPHEQRIHIITANDAYDVFKKSWDDNKLDLLEEAKLLLLNRSNRVLGLVELSQGGITGTVVDLKVIFATALKTNASSIILAHNHPSGNLTPSSADESLTKQIHSAGKLLTIALTDHLIITRDGYYSFADDLRLF